MTPTQRTLKWLRDQGYLCGIVERFLAYAGTHGKRQDLFSIIDIIAIKPGVTVGVQSCGTAFSEHNKKFMAYKVSKVYKANIVSLVSIIDLVSLC